MFFFFHLLKGTCIINETKLGRKSINKVNLKCRQDANLIWISRVCSCFKTNWLLDIWVCLSEEPPNRRKFQQLRHLHPDDMFSENSCFGLLKLRARLRLEMGPFAASRHSGPGLQGWKSGTITHKLYDFEGDT